MRGRHPLPKLGSRLGERQGVSPQSILSTTTTSFVLVVVVVVVTNNGILLLLNQLILFDLPTLLLRLAVVEEAATIFLGKDLTEQAAALIALGW